jgi:hypothetical protein
VEISQKLRISLTGAFIELSALIHSFIHSLHCRDQAKKGS